MAPPRPAQDPIWFRCACIGVSGLFIIVLLMLPLVTVFAQALSHGVMAAAASLSSSDSLSAIGLTLIVAAISVPINTAFGIAAAWLVTKYDFRGKDLLTALIDLPFSVSPVVAGLAYALVFGLQGWFGAALRDWNIKVIFALPGIVLATLFVSAPFVARSLIPLMNHQGREEEEVALSLGASGWRTFLLVTLPNVKWGLLYGVLLCNARAMGEFGAVSVVSGHIRGVTDTMPVHVQVLYEDYDTVGAFSVAGLLALLALLTLVVKSLLEWRYADQIAAEHRR